jgi:hypothetical protein
MKINFFQEEFKRLSSKAFCELASRWSSKTRNRNFELNLEEQGPEWTWEGRNFSFPSVFIFSLPKVLAPAKIQYSCGTAPACLGVQRTK